MRKNSFIDKIRKPYIIAEIGSNFNQNLNTAYKLIIAAKMAGADAVKFQLFKAQKLYPENEKMFNLFKSIELNSKWIPKLKKFSEDNNIEFLSSAFDIDSIKILESNNIIAHKVASSEATNFELLKVFAKTKKPIIFSTGMCDIDDVKKAYNLFKKTHMIIMQCCSVYPLNNIDVNLNVIKCYKKKFPKARLGFSDHTLGNTAAITATGLGAIVFEKHLTLNKKSKGPDHFYALEPKELKNYIRNIHDSYSCLGSEKKDLLLQEKIYGRRDGLYAKTDLNKNKKLYRNDIYSKRPALGLRSKYINKIIGLKIKKKIYKDQPIYETNIKDFK
jgi:sialic acid synthase SpsE